VEDNVDIRRQVVFENVLLDELYGVVKVAGCAEVEAVESDDIVLVCEFVRQVRAYEARSACD